MQTDATLTCELLMGLRDVTVLGIDERLRQPLEVCVDPRHPGSIALSRSQKVQLSLFDAVTSKWGMPPRFVPGRSRIQNAPTEYQTKRHDDPHRTRWIFVAHPADSGAIAQLSKLHLIER